MVSTTGNYSAAASNNPNKAAPWAASIVTYKKKLPFVVVNGITRNGAPGTACGNSVSFKVIFSEEVFGVDKNDFVVTTTTGSVTGTSVASVTDIDGTNYTVIVNTGSGNGSIRLDLVDNDSILDIDATPLGGSGPGNGNFNTGESYTISRSAPTFTTCPSPGPTANTAPGLCSATVTYTASASGGCCSLG